MDFAVMGTINSYVKRKNLTFAAKHKIRTGQTLVNANGNWSSSNVVSTFDKLRESAKTATDKAKQEKLRRIKQKLRGGQKLSDEELGFLRVNDPKTYKKAKHADEAREELKAELKQAKSKSEAHEAMAELSALGSGVGNVVAGNSGGEFSANISGGEISSTDNGANNQTLSEVNQSVQSIGERATSELSNTTNDTEKFSTTQKNSDDKNTPEDIMEKYIWTIRALEDEWLRFTNSDDYKNLPDNISDEITDKNFHKHIYKPNRKLLKAIRSYELVMRNDFGSVIKIPNS